MDVYIQIFRVAFRKLLALAERATEAPIMKRRINAGSDEYFDWESEHEGESELDEVLDHEERIG